MYIDVHVKAVLDGMPSMPLDVQESAKAFCKDRLKKLESGVSIANGIAGARFVANGLGKHFNEKFQFRHDFESNCLVLDKWDRINEVWIPLFWWWDDNQKAKKISEFDLPGLIEKFELADMTKYPNPMAYLAAKRKRAAAVRKARELASDEKVAAAIDNMSTSQIEKFIEVHTAIARGEKVIAHGEDLRFLEHAEALTKQALAAGEVLADHPDAVINPGHDPLLNAGKR